MTTGINLSVYYSTVIFLQVGLSDFLAQLLAAVMATAFALGTYPLPWTIERVGRRNVLIWSAVILTICMIVFVTMIGLPNPTNATQWTAVAAIVVYNFVFGYGWIGVPWLYGPEVSSRPFREGSILTALDRTTKVSTSRWCSWSFRRVALLVHHRFRWRYRTGQCRLENLDLDVAFVCRGSTFRVVHVP